MLTNARWLPTLCISSLLLGACEQQPEPSEPDTGTPALSGTETSKDFGDYVVHFNALSTEQLTPQVASQYGIVRSKNRAILNVSILRKQTQGLGTAVSGSVSASAINLTGQLKNLTFREIKEGQAIYYIAQFAVADEETLIFSIDVTPINESSRFSVRFKKQFFVD
jgi:hypothetical protein